jgi:itaconate CoA-transferase
MESPDSVASPLEGITVVALEHAVAAPFTTRHLADLGARVIKVERPGVGDFAREYDRSVHGQASYFVWLNRGKESVELDLKSDADRAVLDGVLDSADVLVQNLLPGAVDRLGLDAATLRARRPELIHCSISGYGTGGPYSDKKAYDLLVQCESGLLSTTGSPEQPSKVGVSVVDIATGMYAYSGILAALYERERTGVGATLSVSMLEAVGEWMMQPTYLSVYGEQPFRRTGARHASIAPYGPYRVLDGTVFIGVQSDREWGVLCRDILQRPDLVDDERFARNTERAAHDELITAVIERVLASQYADDVVRALEQHGLACARMRTPQEFHDHPQLEARDRWREVRSPAGPVRALLPPVVIEGREAPMGDIPALGQHTEAVRPEGVLKRSELIMPEPALALAGLLDVAPPALASGEGLPLLWHWLYLLERPLQSELGLDGHPVPDALPAPPGPGRRRMWAGGAVRSLAPLRVGVEATRTSRVLRTAHKTGRSGPLTFVTVGHTIEQGGQVVVEERQDILYRDAVTDQPQSGSEELPGVPVEHGEWAVPVSPTLLFRFSARDYAREVEGYPGLVVHGPLQALVMAELARTRGTRTDSGTSMDYRLVAPLYDDQGLVVSVVEAGHELVTSVRDSSGRRTAHGRVATF